MLVPLNRPLESFIDSTIYIWTMSKTEIAFKVFVNSIEMKGSKSYIHGTIVGFGETVLSGQRIILDCYEMEDYLAYDDSRALDYYGNYRQLQTNAELAAQFGYESVEEYEQDYEQYRQDMMEGIA